MISLFAIGTYLMIGSFVALFCWLKRNKDAWLANHPIFNGLLFLYLMATWPKFFAIFVPLLRKRLAERRANGRKIVVVNSAGETFHIVPAKTYDRTE